MCVRVTLAWPGGKVGRQENQCGSSQAFFPRLAGFITATNDWPDKSSYFILPSSTSALLSLFIPLKPPSPCFQPSLWKLCMLHLAPCPAHPHFSFTYTVIYWPQPFLPHCLSFLHTYTVFCCCFFPPPSSAPPLAPLYLPPSLHIVWWICRQGLIIVLQPKCSFFFVFESCDRQGLFVSQPPSLLFLPLFSSLLFVPAPTQWVSKITQGLQGHAV